MGYNIGGCSGNAVWCLHIFLVFNSDFGFYLMIVVLTEGTTIFLGQKLKNEPVMESLFKK
jgi:hypothetical protein